MKVAKKSAFKSSGSGHVLITGGAGFIGTNLAKRLLSSGKEVLILDNLSRPGVEHNLHALKAACGPRLKATVADVRSDRDLRTGLRGAEQVFHFAAQVAVTTSLEDPRLDFDTNLLGTFNLLEALRSMDRPPPLVYTSTNKVYGRLEGLPLVKSCNRYEPVEPGVLQRGISEEMGLSFCSPYGCSKGASDQYVIDYAKTYGLKAVVFRMSCIYGPHQLGTEDQGWVAHFIIRMLQGEPITIYGDGLQVRDVLFVEDLVDAMLLAQKKMDTLTGRPFNIGGGPSNATSLKEVLNRLGALHGSEPRVKYSDWRQGDQRYFVSDIGSFNRLTGWYPKIGAAEGIERLYRWFVNLHMAAAEGGTGAAGN